MSKMNSNEIQEMLQTIHVEWSVVGGSSLTRVFNFEDFNHGLQFVNDIAKIADKTNHHPDIELTYSKVTINLSTHSEGGLTEKDFDFAKEIDKQDD